MNKTIFAIGAFALTAVIAFGTATILDDAHKLLRDVDQTVLEIQKDEHGTSQNINAVLIQAGLAADQAQQAAREQRIAWAKNSIEVGETAVAARLLIDRTDRSLNDDTLPLLRSSITDLAWNGNQSLAALTAATNDLDARVNDPALTDTLNHLNLAALHLDLATGNANAILAHGAHVTDYYDRKLTTPVGFVRQLLDTTLGIGAKLGSIAAGVK